MFNYNPDTKTLGHGKQATGINFYSAEEAIQLLSMGQIQDVIEAVTGKRPGRYSSKDKAIPHLAEVLKGLKPAKTVEAPPKGTGKVAQCWALFKECASRKEALERGQALGLNRGTLATQWQKFHHQRSATNA